MYPADFAYVRPDDLGGVFAALREAGERAKVIAGGQSLLPMMKLRLAAPAVLVDLAGAGELRGRFRLDSGVRIGALTTYRDLQHSRQLLDLLPGLADTLAVIADPQVRARGTIGGAVAHGDPTADLPALLLALDARVRTSSPRGERAVELADFLTGVFTTDLEEDEIVTAVDVPLPAPGTGAAYEKFEQPASHLALCGVAVAVSVEHGRVARARVAMTGVTSSPRRLPEVEQLLLGASPDGALLDAAARAATHGVTPLEDLHASAAYRLQLLKLATRQAAAVALTRAGMGWVA